MGDVIARGLAKKNADQIGILYDNHVYVEKFFRIIPEVDDSPRIQRALDSCVDGTTLWFTKPVYECKTNLVVNTKIWWRGTSRDGVLFNVYSQTGNGFIEFVAKQCRMTDVSFYYPEQVRTNAELATNGGTVKVYPPTLYGCGYYASFERLNMGNAYDALRFGREPSGTLLYSSSAIVLRDIIGTPLHRGLVLDACRDVPKIQNIHWNRNIFLGTSKELESDVYQWIRNNGYAFHFGRADWTTCIGLFAFGYNRGILMQPIESPGASDIVSFESCQFDQCAFPVWLVNFQSVVHFQKCTFVGKRVLGTSSSNIGYIILQKQNTTVNLVTFDRCEFYDFPTRIAQINCNSIFTNCNFSRWATDGGIDPAIYAIESGTRQVVDNCNFDGETATGARGIWNNDVSDVSLVLRNTKFRNTPQQPYRWVNGVAIDAGGNDFGGTQPRNQIGFYSQTDRYKANTMPTSGSYNTGDYVENTVPTETSAKRSIKGWVRLTTGSNHVLGTDWQEDYIELHRFKASAMPTTGTYTNGDYVENTSRTVQGTAGSKYIVRGWQRLVTGSAHVLNTDWVEDRGLTGT